MKSRDLIVGASLLVGLLLGIGLWYQVAHLRLEERHRVWMAYVRGPLKLYVASSRQGAAWVGPNKLKPEQARALGEAVQGLAESWNEAVAQQEEIEEDAFFSELDASIAWHASASQLADTWPRLDRRNAEEVATAQSAAEGIRRNLALKVGHQWDRMRFEAPLAPADFVECQALMDELAKPLPKPAPLQGFHKKRRDFLTK